MVFKRTMFLLLLQNFLLVSSTLVGLGYRHHSGHSLLTDKAALLEFKKAIKSDPTLALANWHESNDVCNFTGVICNVRHHRVVNLTLNRTGLVGHISPFISNLTGLRYLLLAENIFLNSIPPEISSLRRLILLKLTNNNIPGSIPVSLSLLQNLQLLHLSGNNLIGPIPASLFSNCTMLMNIDLSSNRLNGSIPPEIGNCPQLWTLNLYNNQFTGQIPLSLTNSSSSLINLDLEYNHISGILPSDVVGKLNLLVYLHLSYNDMVSHDNNTNLNPFFASLMNCSSLEELEMEGMSLGGKLPKFIGQLGVNLTTFVLNGNQISGSIPSSLGNFSKLSTLNLSSNLLSGTIPPEFGGLSNLLRLVLSHNLLNGSIPKKLGNIRGLGHLDLSYNSLSGNIPESIGNLVQLNLLFLNNNNLSGSVPRSIGKCIVMNKLDLSYNKLTGSIPSEISGLLEIRIFLNLSNNLFEGTLPIELSKMQSVQEIDLSSNKFDGGIFDQILNCFALRLLNLSHNALQGPLPDALGDFKSLEVLDVSSNHLSGKIPASLNRSHLLIFLNLSFNNLEGQIPSGGVFDSANNFSFFGNPHLCGLRAGIACHKKRNWLHSHMFVIIFSVVISISAFLSTIGCVIGCRYIKRIMSSRNSATVWKSTPDLMHNIRRITYRELSEATGGFDEQRLIGSGSYGRVYKGVLSDGTAIAVKVLQLQTGNSTKSFNRECQVLKRIRHRNLIRIITACSLPDFKALVLPYMANGSLDSRLYPHTGTGLGSGSSDLSLIQRVNICSDIAEGMAYLHHHSPVRVIHCDLKPSNVLLNDDMTALVSDFGISRLVTTMGNAGAVENTGNSTANMLCGSIGYIPPGKKDFITVLNN